MAVPSHIRRPRLIKAKLPERPYVDPYRPNAPDFAERHRQHSTEIAPGLIRTDIGEPIPAPGRTFGAAKEKGRDQ